MNSLDKYIQIIKHSVSLIYNDSLLARIQQLLKRYARKIDIQFAKRSPQLVYGKWTIVYVELGINIGSEIFKTRPCVVMSPSIYNSGDTILICPITSLYSDIYQNPKNTTSHQYVVLYPNIYNNLDKPSVLNIWQMRCISKKRLWNKIWHLDKLTFEKLNKKLSKYFGI